MKKNTAKMFPSKNVKIILRHLGLREGKGNGTGHEIWVDEIGRRFQLAYRHNEIPFPHLQALGLELEIKQVCSRRSFIHAVKHVRGHNISFCPA